MSSELLTKRQLGEFVTTPLGLGTARLGAFWQKRSVKEGEETLRLALNLGVGLIDTADVYARGISERIVGKVTKNSEAVVMTKVGLLKTPRGLVNSARFGNKPGLSGLKAATAADTCFAPAYLEAAALQCMKRQQRDELDILLLHEPTADDFARGEFIETLNSMKERGMIRAWGASTRTAEAAVAAMDAEGLTWLQAPANLGNRGAAEALAQHPRKAEVTTVGLAVLGDGSLMPEASRLGLTPTRAVAALTEGAYNLPGIDSVLLGMSRPNHVKQNLAALARGANAADIETLLTQLSID